MVHLGSTCELDLQMQYLGNPISQHPKQLQMQAPTNQECRVQPLYQRLSHDGFFAGTLQTTTWCPNSVSPTHHGVWPTEASPEAKASRNTSFVISRACRLKARMRSQQRLPLGSIWSRIYCCKCMRLWLARLGWSATVPSHMPAVT